MGVEAVEERTVRSGVSPVHSPRQDATSPRECVCPSGCRKQGGGISRRA